MYICANTNRSNQAKHPTRCDTSRRVITPEPKCLLPYSIPTVGEPLISRWRTYLLTLNYRPTTRGMPKSLGVLWIQAPKSASLLLGHQQVMRSGESSASGRDSRWPSAAKIPYHGYGTTGSRFNPKHPDDGSVCHVCAKRPPRHSHTNPKAPKTLNSTSRKLTATGIHQDDDQHRQRRKEARGFLLLFRTS